MVSFAGSGPGWIGATGFEISAPALGGVMGPIGTDGHAVSPTRYVSSVMMLSIMGSGMQLLIAVRSIQTRPSKRAQLVGIEPNKAGFVLRLMNILLGITPEPHEPGNMPPADSRQEKQHSVDCLLS